MDRKLVEYIEGEILPFYDEHIKCHGSDHVRYVIRRSLDFAEQITDQQINRDMVYTIAAFHDIGIVVDRATHEMEGAKMLRSDKTIKQIFTPEQINIMAEAIEDHRASSNHEPRSIYGRIVSSADRYIGVDAALRSVYKFRIKYSPSATLDEIIDESITHIFDKFGDGGYALQKIYFRDTEYEDFCRQLCELAGDREKFRQRLIVANALHM